MGLSRRMLVMLDVIIGVLVVLNLAPIFLPQDGPGPVTSAVGAAGTLAVVACWVAWRVTRERRWLLGLALAAAPAGASGGGGIPLLLMLLALALLVASFGLGYGLAGLAYVVAFGAVAMVLYGQPTATIALESLAGLLLGGLGLLLGQLLRELHAERRANARLLEEVRAAHDIEKELMLADERARSARELHDGLGHRLTLIGMALEYAARMRDKDPDKAYAEVQQARQEATDALAYMRRWVRALNPPRETRLSGIRAFDALAESFRGTGLTVEVHQTGDEHPLGREASLFAYRLVQEGLTNVLRHSAADRVDLTVHWRGDGVGLELADNGLERAGGSLDPVEPGFGLRSLAERAAELGGEFAARVTDRGVVLTGSVREPSPA